MDGGERRSRFPNDGSRSSGVSWLQTRPRAWQGRAWLVAQGAVAAQHVELPWLGVWLTPDMLDALKVLDWLGDAQRSIAWAILDGVAPDGTAE